MKVTFFSSKTFEEPYYRKANPDGFELNFIKDSLGPDNTQLASESDVIVTFPNDQVNAEVLDKLKEMGIEYVASRSAGTDHLDVEHAKEIGIKLSNVPEYSPYAIAEHAIGMMLVLNRKYLIADKKIWDHDFRLEGMIGFDMHGKTVGILGAGKIGAIVVKILNGFGCEVLIFDPDKNEELEKKYNARYVDLDELCEKSRIISIHAPLNEKTRHLINKDTLSKMQDGVMLINAGRGPIIKTPDLIEALKSGKVGSTGLDVYEKEKGLFFYDHSQEPLQDEEFAYLQANKNVFITSHQAFVTDTALQNMAKITFDNIRSWQKGEDAPHQL